MDIQAEAQQRYAVLNRVGEEILLLTSIEPDGEKALSRARAMRDAWMRQHQQQYQSLFVGVIEFYGINGKFRFIRAA
jgi:hypothetical protein